MILWDSLGQTAVSCHLNDGVQNRITLKGISHETATVPDIIAPLFFVRVDQHENQGIVSSC